MLSAQACLQCRRLKRKCSREQPSCALCVRLRKPCVYDEPHPSEPVSIPGGGSSLEALAARVQQLESAATQRSGDAAQIVSVLETGLLSRFPVAYFLDRDYFTPLPSEDLSFASVPLSLSMEAMAALGASVEDTCHIFSETTDQWLPLISATKVVQDAATKHQDNPGLTLLLLSMRLVSDATCRGVCHAYRLAKSLSSTAENEGIISLRLVQSLALLAFYELGHGIYPAAYLTVGRAARLAMLMNYHDKKAPVQLFKPSDRWTSIEEERRSWWTILLLDRFCNIGVEGLQAATSNIQINQALPVNDRGWDVRSVAPGDVSALLTAESFSRCAMTSQVAHILSHVITHRESRSTSHLDEMSCLSEAIQIHNTLAALDERLHADLASHATIPQGTIISSALLCSARFVLYSMYGCQEPDVRSSPAQVKLEFAMRRNSVDGIISMCTTRVPQIAQSISRDESPAGGRQPLGRAVSPTVAHCLYIAATECAWLIREGYGPDMMSGLKAMIAALERMKDSWDVTATYLKLLGQDETVSAVLRRG